MQRACLVLVLLAVPLAPGGGCATYTQQGALIGTLGGAGIGLLGGPVGVVVGGGVGLIAGTLIGAHLDDEFARRDAFVAAATPPRGGQVGVSDVVEMSHAGVGDPVIITAIRESGSWYQLSATDIVALREQGVTEAVINEMMNARPTSPPATRTTVIQHY